MVVGLHFDCPSAVADSLVVWFVVDSVGISDLVAAVGHCADRCVTFSPKLESTHALRTVSVGDLEVE